jgi:hypothetical protein
MKVYVASSWRNAFQRYVVNRLREAGHNVYDFRNPAPNQKGFSWSEIDPKWKTWTGKRFIEVLDHPLAREGFRHDITALDECDACVLVLPCGASAHLELGEANGAKKKTAVLFPDPLLVQVILSEDQDGTITLGKPSNDRPMEYYPAARHLNIEPELMYKMVGCVTDDLETVVEFLKE